MPTLKEEVGGEKKDGKEGKPHWTTVFSTRMSQIRQRFENRCSAEKARNSQPQIKGKFGGAGKKRLPSIQVLPTVEVKEQPMNHCNNQNDGEKKDRVHCGDGNKEEEDDYDNYRMKTKLEDDSASNFGSHILQWENKWDSLDRENGKKGDTKPLTPVPWRKLSSSSNRPLSFAGESEVYEKAGYRLDDHNLQGDSR